ncbi:response regulator [Nocardia caishijiensis]|uniref:LuxR family two component transcriptional regulator n=1 Tax=Nocardia caishijiensis TaxID=184756 RepID=A0ABQ6YIY2_9NOCA|nr:response regulator transcription factor [Nocardia caishijiensis]KAF0845742.1 LuxR family two component transcriptional regulator [Nocardia caishijiensis]
MTLRVVLADDEVLFRTGLRHLLEHEGMSVVGEAGDADALLALIEEHGPDLAIVDIRMPPLHRTEGLAATAAIRARYPGTAVMLLSAHVETEEAVQLLAGGARGIGYMLKDRCGDVAAFIGALHQIAAGGTAIEPTLVTLLLQRPHRGHRAIDELTHREREVLAAMAEGKSNPAIARALGCTKRTVESHIMRIFDKLGLEIHTEDDRRVRAVLVYLKEQTR